MSKFLRKNATVIGLFVAVIALLIEILNYFNVKRTDLGFLTKRYSVSLSHVM